jgi:hypothetical protein
MKLSAVQPVRWVMVSRCRCPTRRRGGQRKLSEARLLAPLVQRNGAIARSIEADDRQLGRCKTADYAVGCCILKSNAPEAHLPDRVCVPARRARLSARPSLRRGRHAHGARQCPDPLGGDSFCRHTHAASFIRATLHRYSTFEEVWQPAATANGLSGRRIFRLPSSAPLQ